MVIVPNPSKQNQFGNLTPNKSSGKNTALIIFGIVLAIVIVGLLLYFFIFRNISSAVNNLLDQSSSASRSLKIKPKDINKLMENETLKDLKGYTQLPPLTSPRGRDNPFLPY